MFDIVVVGGGPAGMTAAIYARRNGKSVLVIEKNGFGGQITNSPKVENFPGTISASGTELADRMMEHMLSQGAEIELENVIRLEKTEDTWHVMTEEGHDFETRTVILANGVRHRTLGLPGEEELIGEGISFCAVCDGDFYRDRETAVIGGGNSALQEALLLADVCKRVTILQDLPYLTGEERLQSLLKERANVTIFTGVRVEGFLQREGVLCAVQARSVQENTLSEIPCEGVFEAIGLIPENDAFAPWVSLNAQGYYAEGEQCTTKTPGLFVAGDCREKRVRQLTTAVSDGATAALAACDYIRERMK